MCPCNLNNGASKLDMIRRFKYLVTHNDFIKDLFRYSLKALARTTGGTLEFGANVTFLPSLTFLAPGRSDDYNQGFCM